MVSENLFSANKAEVNCDSEVIHKQLCPKQFITIHKFTYGTKYVCYSLPKVLLVTRNSYLPCTKTLLAYCDKCVNMQNKVKAHNS